MENGGFLDVENFNVPIFYIGELVLKIVDLLLGDFSLQQLLVLFLHISDYSTSILDPYVNVADQPDHLDYYNDVLVELADFLDEL